MSCVFDGTSDASNFEIYIGATKIPTVCQFKYLGSIISNDGKIDKDVTHRTTVGWQKWRELTGVICDKKMPIKVKGKIYKSAIRPALLYGSECWATCKQQINKMHVTEMRMLRWSGGVTLLDKIRNDFIRGSFKVAPISDKLKENRLRWYGHILRRPEDHMVKIALNMPTQKRGKGRPPATWLTTVEKDMKDVNTDAEIAKNRGLWRKRTRKADPK
ncbi:uncharacterized protein LOC134673382 [Cydia fagiglandana]|uniref:uncharacterized protein LOC134671661 n=1 Tax=Cydia fagiglandana TaxID=1458189 RepID=UPI002FEE0EEB